MYDFIATFVLLVSISPSDLNSWLDAQTEMMTTWWPNALEFILFFFRMTSLQETRMFATGRKDVGTTHILNPAVQPRKGFSLWMWHHLAANTYCIKFMCHHSGNDEMQERIYSARKEIAGSKKKKKRKRRRRWFYLSWWLDKNKCGHNDIILCAIFVEFKKGLRF